MRMSSIMRWRSGVTAEVDTFMALLLSMNEADCLTRQHRRTNVITDYRGLLAAGYRESGFVLRRYSDIGTGCSQGP
jgi:hypothetical protein